MKLIIIRGLPGSGKTTAAREMFKGLAHCGADQYFYRIGGCEYKIEHKKLNYAHAWCQKEVERYLIYGISCVISNTFVKVREMQPYFDLAKKYDAEVEIYDWEPVHCKFISKS